MQLLIYCILIVSSLTPNDAGESVERLLNEDDYCLYNGKQSLIVRRGEKLNVPHDCMQLECDNNKRLFARTCPEIEASKDPQCKVTAANYNKKYPSCCPTLECV